MQADFSDRQQEVKQIQTAVISAEQNLMYSLNDINKIIEDVQAGKLLPSSRLIYLTDFIKNASSVLADMLGDQISEDQMLINFNKIPVGAKAEKIQEAFLQEVAEKDGQPVIVGDIMDRAKKL